MTQSVIAYKIYNSSELSIIAKHVEELVSKWISVWFKNSQLIQVSAKNAFDEAKQISRFFRDDTWLSVYNFCYEHGHAWGMLDDKSMDVYLREQLNTQSRVNLSCKSSRSLCEGSIENLAAMLCHEHTLPHSHTKLTQRALNKGSGWCVVEIHTSQWSLQLLLSSILVKRWLRKTPLSSQKKVGLTKRGEAVNRAAMNLFVELDIPAISLKDIGYLREGDIIPMHRCSKPDVKIKNAFEQTICHGLLGIRDQRLSVELVKGD